MLLVSLAIAGAGFGVAFWVMQRPVPAPTKPPRPEGEVLPPTQLEGLGYLSADTNIAFAVQPGAVEVYAKRTNQDARGLLINAGLPGELLNSLTNLGLTIPQIDSLVGGTSLGDAAFMVRFTLVLTLRAELKDEDEFLERLKAKPQAGGKEWYDVEVKGLPVTVVARVSPTIWVFGFDAKDLEAAARGGYGTGGRQLSNGLVTMLSQQVPADAAAWVATNDERWLEKPGVKFLVENGVKKAEWLPALAHARGGMAALVLGEQPRLRLFVKVDDAATGKQVRDYFAKRAATDAKIKHGGEGESAFFDAPLDPANAFGTIQQFLRDVEKK